MSVGLAAANLAGATGWGVRMIRAAVLDADIDLRSLLGAIAEHGIRFRVNEESGSQVIWVATQADADKVAQALIRWQELREQGLVDRASPSAKRLA